MNKCFLYNNCNHIDCDKFCMKKYKLDYLYDQSLLSEYQKIYKKLIIDKDGTDLEEFTRLKYIETNIETFVNNGYNLFIHSNICGNGKTSWAIRMIQAYFNKIWSKTDLTCKALFINVPRFLLELKSNISQKSDYIEHINNNILEADLVIWDEIGLKNLTSFEHENILSLINSRLDMNKSNIYTSNLNLEELHQALGDRLYSRVVNYSEEIILNGADKRAL